MSQPSDDFVRRTSICMTFVTPSAPLVATPVVSAVAILSLALGIGANTAIFSILDSLILRTLPVEEPQRLVLLDRGSWTNPIWEAIRERQQAFNGAMAWSTTRFNLAQGGQTEMVDGIWASGAFFDVLGVPAILGRTFAPEDDRRGGGPDGPVAVISYNFWQRHFGGGVDVVGKPLLVERVTYTIIGVTPPDFFGTEVGRKFDVAIPIGTEPLVRGKESALDRRSNWWLSIMLRLHPGQDAAAATAALRGVQPQIRDGHDASGLAGTVQEDVSPGRLYPRSCRDGKLRAAPPLSATAHGNHGCRGAGPAHRVRQHRQPPARASQRAAARAQRPCRARRIEVPHRPPVADRECGAVRGGRPDRASVRPLGQPSARSAALDDHEYRVSRPRPRLASSRVHRPRRGDDGRPFWSGPGPSSIRGAAERSAERTGARGGRRTFRSRQSPRRRSGGAVSDPGRRRESVRANVLIARKGQSGIRSQARARGERQRASGCSSISNRGPSSSSGCARRPPTFPASPPPQFRRSHL